MLRNRPTHADDARPSKKSKSASGVPSRPVQKTKALSSRPKVTATPAATLSKPPKDAHVPSRPDKKGKKRASDVPETLPSTFKVIAGSYEKLLYGLEGTVSKEGSELQFHLKPMFIFPAHISSVKAVASSPNGGKWLATGSSDEIVKVWDLRRRKEIGGLMHHEGSITHLEFPSRSHLLSASEDGTLCLFHARDWSVLRTLKGHKGYVNSVAVHPSGKVALSVGKDRTLRMWDLMRGKGSASMKLGTEGELVRWSVDGTLFAVQSMSKIDLYTTDMTLVHTLDHRSRLHDVRFCRRVGDDGEVLLAAAENKMLSIYDVPSDRTKTPTIIAAMVGHTNRVKAVDTLRVSLPGTPSSTTLVSTISSDGKVRVYDLAAIAKESPSGELLEISPVAEYDTKGSRLTCMTMADGDSVPQPINGKRARETEDPGSDGDNTAGSDESDEWQS